MNQRTKHPGGWREELPTMALLALGLWLVWAWFPTPNPLAGWNVNSRLALSFALVERGTLRIDAYHDLPAMPTGDKAYFEGHYYCDKAPLLSFTAVPPYVALWQAGGLGLLDRSGRSDWVFLSRYLLRVLSVGLPGALLGALLFLWARRLGLDHLLALLLALFVCLGTPLAGYGRLFYPYLPASLCLAGAWFALQRQRLAAGRPSLGAGVVAGLLVGLAWFYDFTCGLAGLGLSAYALWTFRRRPGALALYLVAGLLSPLCFFAYTHHIFGEFAIPYRYEVNDLFRENMARGFQGIGRPRLSVLYYLLLHPFRGLLLFSPVLVLWPVALLAGWRSQRFRPYRADLLLSAFVAVGYLLFNAGYYMWWGGWATMPRLLNPALVFAAPPLALWVAAGCRWKRGLFLLLGLLSIFFQGAVMATDPQAPTAPSTEALMAAEWTADFAGPMFGFVLPHFLAGRLAPNLGQLLFGLDGHASLLPLAGAGGLMVLLGSWYVRRRGGTKG